MMSAHSVFSADLQEALVKETIARNRPARILSTVAEDPSSS